VYSQWSNDVTYDYDTSVFGTRSYNVPGDYFIEANAAPGRRTPPQSGWTTLVHVSGNTYHSAAQIVDMTGYNWLRLRATAGAPNNAAQNTDLAIKWDIYDASPPPVDSWIFYGDSITAAGMVPYPSHPGGAGGPGDSFASQINRASPSFLPAQQDGGVGGLTANYVVSHGLLSTWLSAYPGRYVALCLGTNDANVGGFNAEVYYRDLDTMVRQVEQTGKVVLIPTLVASTTAGIQANGPTANDEIRRLYRAHPEVIPGPDLWTLFRPHPEWISADHLHPTDLGYAQLRNAWAAAALQALYRDSRRATD
jgi:lysophospholipase L1-like esterase